mmetsp:Transcript_14201/g.33163  ORF Transcript_14201/g.33163 Transcript_14201/m.33163 type:complete len:627 (+) Transcript_14201:55-1935(+)
MPVEQSSMQEQCETVLDRLKPHPRADKHRSRVLRHVRTLIRKKCSDAKVCAFGSVPLKTYLPHGDLDLTVFSTGGGDYLLTDIADELRQEVKNENAQVVIRDVHCVNHERVEVKVVKCVVDDVPVDISLNQYGGLRTLCFLESFDRLVGQNHLYKEALLLIKGWCYFESRILGSQHGLIATYALETLVLCVLNLFHLELSTPLEVLLKFLVYYSTFAWDSHFVTINGPVAFEDVANARICPLPSTVLISEEHLKPFQDTTTPHPELRLKYMNVLDPLVQNNNLGRSVSKGNFLRIRRALACGRKSLEEVLAGSDPKKDLMSFFRCTLRTLGGGPGADLGTRVRPDLGCDFSSFATPSVSTRSEVSSERMESVSTLSGSDAQLCSSRLPSSAASDCLQSASQTSDDDLMWCKHELAEHELHHVITEEALPWVIPVAAISELDRGNLNWDNMLIRDDLDDVDVDEKHEVMVPSSLSTASVSASVASTVYHGIGDDADGEFCSADILAADLSSLTRQLHAVARIIAEAPATAPHPRASPPQQLPPNSRDAFSWMEGDCGRAGRVARARSSTAAGTKPPQPHHLASATKRSGREPRKLDFSAEKLTPNPASAAEFPSLGSSSNFPPLGSH